MMYHQRAAFTPEQREARNKDLFRCIVISAILWTGLCLLSLCLHGCQRKAYAPRNNPKPRHIGLIRDREAPQPRYSPYVWAEDTTTH